MEVVTDPDATRCRALLAATLVARGDAGAQQEARDAMAVATGPDGVLLAAEEDGATIGVVCGDRSPETGTVFVRWLVVDTAHRRRGVGRSLMDALETTPNVLRVTGMVDREDPVALTFWQGRGWTPRRPPRPGRRRILMGRDLGPQRVPWTRTDAADAA